MRFLELFDGKDCQSKIQNWYNAPISATLAQSERDAVLQAIATIKESPSLRLP